MGPSTEAAAIKKKPEAKDEPQFDLVKATIVHGVLVAGFLAVHFGVVRLW
jgi:hypothetical protein